MPAPEAMPGEVVIRVDGCGICGSDLTSYKVGLFTDAVPGHELAGVVESVGDGVIGWAAGDTAVVDPKIPCGVCDDCRTGARIAAPWRSPPASGLPATADSPNWSRCPRRCCTAFRPGWRSSTPVWWSRCRWRSTAWSALGSTPASRSWSSASVPIGLFTVATLHARGIGPIVGVDPVQDRRRLALDLGAATAVSELREVRGHVAPVPAVIECSGYAPLLHAAADLVAPGGRLVLVGVPFGEATVIPLMWVTREIEIIGSIASSAADFAMSLEMLAADPGIARVATRRDSLAQVPEVFEELITPSSGGKVVVDPEL